MNVKIYLFIYNKNKSYMRFRSVNKLNKTLTI